MKPKMAWILVPVFVGYEESNDSGDIKVHSVATPSFEDCEVAVNEYAATAYEDKLDAFNELEGYY